jgi:hypothetical protein
MISWQFFLPMALLCGLAGWIAGFHRGVGEDRRKRTEVWERFGKMVADAIAEIGPEWRRIGRQAAENLRLDGSRGGAETRREDG